MIVSEDEMTMEHDGDTYKVDTDSFADRCHVSCDFFGKCSKYMLIDLLCCAGDRTDRKYIHWRRT